MGGLEQLSPSNRKIVERYSFDIDTLMKEVRRVVRPGGHVLVVVGNSTIQGVNVSNADINVNSALRHGMSLTSRVERPLPTASRYLPIGLGDGSLGKRMRTETVLNFAA